MNDGVSICATLGDFSNGRLLIKDDDRHALGKEACQTPVLLPQRNPSAPRRCVRMPEPEAIEREKESGEWSWKINTKHKLVMFNSEKLWHETERFDGQRFFIGWFLMKNTCNGRTRLGVANHAELKKMGFLLPDIE